MSLPLLITLALCLLFGVAIAIALGFAGLVGITGFSTFKLTLLAQQLYVALDHYQLAAIPLFVLAANLLLAGGTGQRIADLATSLCRKSPAHTDLLAGALYAWVSPSGVSATTVLSKTPVLSGHAALVPAASAVFGALIPPSTALIVFSVLSGAPISELFVAGIGPALLMILALAFLIYFLPKSPSKADCLPLWRSLIRSLFSIFYPLVVIGGMLGGWFTLVESGAIAVLYALVTAALLHRELNWQSLWHALQQSVITASAVLLIIACAGLVNFLLDTQGVSAQVVQWISAVISETWVFLLALAGILFFLGMFLEIAAVIALAVPLLLPLTMHYHIDPNHFALITIVSLALGSLTLPSGLNLLAASKYAAIPLRQLALVSLPFLFTLLACLALILFVPAVTLFLHDWLLN